MSNLPKEESVSKETESQTVNTLNVINENDPLKNIKIFCPKCLTIPSMDVILKEDGQIHIKCSNPSCSYETTSALKDFLLEIIQNNKKDITIKQGNINCSIHNNILNYHCAQCNLDLCSNCLLENHKGHKPIYDIEKINKDLPLYLEKIKFTIRNGEEYLTGKICEIKENAIKKLNEMIKNLNSSFEKYKIVNKNLIEIMKIILNSNTEKFLCKYQLSNILTLSQLKNKLCTYDLKDDTQKLINYYTNDFICEYNTTNINKAINKIFESSKIKLGLNDTKIEKSTDENTNNFASFTNNIKSTLFEKIVGKTQEEINNSNNNKSKSIKALPNKLIFKENITDKALGSTIPGMFSVFTTSKNQLLVAYATTEGVIEIYDLNKNEIIYSLKNTHLEEIFTCRYYYDSLLSRDLLITSSSDKSVKVWDINNNFNNIVNINTDYEGKFLFSANLIFDSITRSSYVVATEKDSNIKIYKIDGEFVQNLGFKKQGIAFTEIFYDDNKIFILVGYELGVNAFDFNDRSLFKHYQGKKEFTTKGLKITKSDKGNTLLITGDSGGDIKIYDFYKGQLLNSISSDGPKKGINCVCIWDNKYVFAGCQNNKIKLFDLEKLKLIKEYNEHQNYQGSGGVGAIEKFTHPVFGECLFSYGYDGTIKLWVSEEAVDCIIF